jgi:hypothetical protein
MLEFNKYKDDETAQVLIYASTVIQERDEAVTVESLVKQLLLDQANPKPHIYEIEMYIENRKKAIEYLRSSGGYEC